MGQSTNLKPLPGFLNQKQRSLSSLLALKSPKYIQPLSNKHNWCFLVNQKWPSKHKLLHWYRAYPEQWYPKGQLGKPPLTRSLSFFRGFFDGKFRVLLIWIAWLANTWELQQLYQKNKRKIVFHTFLSFLKVDERNLTVVDFKTTKISIWVTFVKLQDDSCNLKKNTTFLGKLEKTVWPTNGPKTSSPNAGPWYSGGWQNSLYRPLNSSSWWF